MLQYVLGMGIWVWVWMPCQWLCDLGPVTSLNSDLGGRFSLKSKLYLFVNFKVYFDAHILGSDTEICSANWPSLFFFLFAGL